MNGLLLVVRMILTWFAKPVESSLVEEKKKDLIPEPKPQKNYLDLSDLITSSGKYPDRANHPELTPEVIANLEQLLKQVTALLNDLKVDHVEVSSGFRPSTVNANIPNAAKKSLHMIGKAVDLADPTNALDKLIESHPELLEKHGLWLESPLTTPSWAHLDIGIRSARKIRIFIP